MADTAEVTKLEQAEKAERGNVGARPDATRLLALSIAEDLFTNGEGERAERLAMKSPERAGQRSHDLGGWSERAVASVIERRLRLAAGPSDPLGGHPLMPDNPETRERPILFSGPMVRAILEGRKVQTRRLAKGFTEQHDGILRRFPQQHGCPYGKPGDRLWVRETWGVVHQHQDTIPESQALEDARQQMPWAGIAYREQAIGGYAAGHLYRWRPSIFLPRWASRLTLEISEVRVQRLQEISEEDAIAEGLRPQVGDGLGCGSGFKWIGIGYEGRRRGYFHVPSRVRDGRCCCVIDGPSPAQCAYRDLWDSINGKRAPWESNPWVWCLTFRRLEPPIRAEE